MPPACATATASWPPRRSSTPDCRPTWWLTSPRTYKSDGSPKGTLFVAGQPVKELKGVYGLDLLRFLADALDVQYRHAMGRGFEAANIRNALTEHFHPKPEPKQA